jgi:predicted XRE-type DNA-binding protein
MNEDIGVIFGSGNVYADLRYDHPEEQLAKAEIVARIARIIEERALTQAQAAEIMGIAQPNISELLRGRFRGYSLDRLFRLLVALDDDVSIVIGPKREGRARLSVTARPA